MHRELDEDEEMVSPLQAGMLLVDWIDPQKSMYVRAVLRVGQWSDKFLLLQGSAWPSNRSTRSFRFGYRNHEGTTW